MNRSQRRKYDRVMKKDPMMLMCPKCGHSARRVRKQVDVGLYDIYCERCETLIETGVRLNTAYERKAAGR